MDKYEEILIKLPGFTSAYEKKLDKKGDKERSEERYQLFKDQVLLTAMKTTSIEITEVNWALSHLAEDFN